MTDLTIRAAIANAPSEFQAALEWFHDRTGQEIGWPKPSPVPGLAHVVSSAKGIYKPQGSTLR